MILSKIISDMTFSGSLSDTLNNKDYAPQKDEVILYWLGQAGFIIEGCNFRLLIDPYLSDSLAKKYKGTAFPHTRMMGSPIAPDELDHLNFVLCTHRHTDHMDPDTLTPLGKRFPHLPFVVPAYSVEEALARTQVNQERLIPVNAEDQVELFKGCKLFPIPSAHETLDINEKGEHQWLGYIIQIGDLKIYHSGDCIPYAGLEETLQHHQIDIALLPVNGRDMTRNSHGIPGNFTLDEAISLSQKSGIKVLLAHHYGLFDFNTISGEEIDRQAEQLNSDTFMLTKAKLNKGWRLKTQW